MKKREYTVSGSLFGPAGMRRRIVTLGRQTVATLLGASLVMSLGVLGAVSATADTAPTDPNNPATPETVSADALPTVQMNGVAWRQLVVGNTVYVVGAFTTARPAGSAPGTNTVVRNNILAYDIRTGNLITSFAPSLNAQATAIAASPDGTRIYVGGQFTTVNGATVWRVAALNATTGALITSFLPKPASTVYSIVATDTTVYMGGLFKAVGAVTRDQLAAFSAIDGSLLGWAPSAVGGKVNAMVLSPDKTKMVVGGQFTTLNGSSNPGYGLGAVDAVSGALLPFAANSVLVRDGGANAAIVSLAADGDQVYGSGFVFGSGGNLEGVFSANWSDGAVKWIQDCHGDTYDVYPDEKAVYAVGHAHYCGNIGGFPQTTPWGFHRGLAFTKAVTGTITPDPYGYFNYAGTPRPSLLNWYPDLDTGTASGQSQGPWTVAGNTSYVVLAGEFLNVNNAAQQGLVRFAKKEIAPNKQGPRLSGSRINPSVVSLSPGTVRIGWQANWDRDNENLTYKVIRDGIIPSPIYTVTQASTFWNRPAMGYVDTGLVPGQEYRYRIFVTDPFNNEVRSETIYVTVADAAAASAYGDKVLADGAADYWRLGEAAGTTTSLDWAGWSDLAVGTGVTRGAAGALANDPNTASTFDATTNGMAATQAALPASNTFSAEMWVKTTTNRGGKILGYGNAATGLSSNYDRHVYMDNSGRIYFGVYNGSVQTVNSSASYNNGQWHHIVASLGVGGMSLWVDGLQVATKPTVTTGQTYNGYWRLGGDNLSGWTARPSNTYLAGSIDEVAIYNSNLTRAQLQSHYLLSGRTLNIPADAYGKAVYDGDPLLYWRVGEATGTTAADSGPSSHPGSYSIGVTKGAAGALSGQSNTAVTFNGITGLLSSNDQFSSPTTFSEELWFKTTTTSGGKLIGFGNARTLLSSTYDRHVYMETNGRLTFGTYTGVQNVATSTSSYNNGQWHHMVATQGANGMKLYVDGALVASNPQTAAQNYNGYWRVGSDTTWGPQPYFAGTIDEVAVYPTAISANAVANHYALGTTGAPANVVPVAAFTSSAVALKASLDGSGSTDSDGTVASYDWDFGDGTPHGSGATLDHSYAVGGTYQVVLTVTDNAGGTGTVTHPVTVAPAPNVVPVAAFSSSVATLTASLDGSGSTDSDGTVASYDWDFGDGSAHGSGATLDHSYAAGGTYQVVLTVTDNSGGTDSVTHPVTVAPANVVPVAAFTSSVNFLQVSLNGSSSTDSDGTVASYDWDFGDGTAHGTGATLNHDYAAAGTYQVVLTVTDNSGGTGTVTQAVTPVAAPAGVLAQDDFGRTVTGGLGSADVGGAWTLSGSASLYSVSGGQAGMALTKAGAGPGAYLNSVSSSSADSVVKFSLDKIANGGGSYVYLLGRSVSGAGDYRAKVKVAADGTLTLYTTRIVGGVETTLRTVNITGFKLVDNQSMTLRLQVIGTGTTTISAKLWRTSTTEPAAWQATGTDTTAALQVPGAVGLFTYMSGSSTNFPVSVKFDGLLVTQVP
ncbi:PKD domain-containing protein [Arthrobacter sp. TMN-49]